MTDPALNLPPPNPIADKYHLLNTKLYRPRSHASLVARPRLVRLLKQSLAQPSPVILVAAPAGFGKTTLLSAWIDELNLPVAWLSLDESDNDPLTFWTYVIAALDGLKAGTGEKAIGLLRDASETPIETILVALINQLTTIPQDFALVIDDYHLIDKADIHQVMAYLIDHLPPQMHLVLTCRSDPPLPLARWRGYGQLMELREDDLRFTPDEAATFLNQVMGLSLSEEHIAVLANRTEGWITGLQLAALSVQRRDAAAVARFVEAFTGQHTFILDYLAEEVFQQQPPAVQEFLLQTAVLNRLHGPLCDALTGRNDGQTMLEQLHQANLFLVPLDDERQWFRYHQLFAEFLRTQLQRRHPGLRPQLHCRAALWLREHGRVHRAIGHAITAEDFVLAADLIETIARSMWQSGEGRRVRQWLESLPENFIFQRPELNLIYAWLLTRDNALQKAEAFVVNLEKQLDHCEDCSSLVGETKAIRAFHHYKQSHSKQSLTLLHEAKATLSEDDLHIRGIVTYLLGHAHRQEDNMPAASQAYSEAIDLNQQAGSVILSLNAFSSLVAIQVTQGQLRQAITTYTQALQYANQQAEQTEWGREILLARTAGLYRGMGTLNCEWNNLSEAQGYLNKAIGMAEASEDWLQLELAQLVLVRLKQAQGDLETAETVLAQATETAHRIDDPVHFARFKARRAWAWLTMGHTEQAIRWAESSGLHLSDMQGSAWMAHLADREREYLTLAWVAIVQGRAAVLPLLDSLAESTRTRDRKWRHLESLSLKVLALHSQGQPEAALEVLGQALHLAEPDGFVRLFVDKGPNIAILLRDLQTTLPDYVAKLQKAFPSYQDLGRGGVSQLNFAPTQPPSSEPLAFEALSPRETEVLHLMAAGLSNRQISENLVITEGTVKGHLHKIYRKLDAHSRTQAIAKARDYRLL